MNWINQRIEENAQELTLIKKKRSGLLDFKKDIGGWGAKEDKITRELEKSG